MKSKLFTCFTLIVANFFSCFIIAMSPDADVLSEKEKKDYWCNDSKDNLKAKFKKLLELYLLEEDFENRDRNAKKEVNQEKWEHIVKLREELRDRYTHACVMLHFVLANKVTCNKIAAFLEEADANPRWGNPTNNRIALLVYLTNQALEEQMVFKNVPCAATVLKNLLDRGVSPLARVSEKQPSAFEVVQKQHIEAKNKIAILKTSKEFNAKQEYREYSKVCKCAEEILNLFNQYHR